MKFSALLSVYHKENPTYLNQALQSIWDQQTLKPDEIILVKDGSLTTELDQIIEQWKNKLENVLKVIALPKNVGLGKALNEGINACSNNWIFRMDTDDIALSDRFEKQVNYLKQHPEIVLLGGQIEEFIGSEKNITAKRLVPCKNQEIISYAQKRSPFNHPTVAYRKDILEKVCLYQHHLLMEDYNLWIRILASGYKAANLPDTLLYMRTDAMHGRRRGLQYIKSEWQLFKLKRELKFQSFLPAFTLLITRSIVRLLPASCLHKIYQFIRK
ncbi:amylovoran biosynthesis protein AmsE [Ignatzschineria ureiclastica]|uniref:Amylovoran biosynthesis protein AmsE n=1 Tax=Ignatzschineria ureiclastica TaxID=472582 RepID=A0A2U2AHB4_9GAMM|nr:glycosyltransferase [Ignatzschineria ureiclastica]PWD82045.1 amylovoran biosynthesis protein AmsE [Ignatzschineria ureiclastica]GGZ92265.1 amylovoran biosynthesis protein AmsE [Ignatzschineria ureiclastica]